MFNRFTEVPEGFVLSVDNLRELYSKGSYRPFDKLSYKVFGTIVSPEYLINNAKSESVSDFISKLLKSDCKVVGTYVSDHEKLLLIRYGEE